MSCLVFYDFDKIRVAINVEWRKNVAAASQGAVVCVSVNAELSVFLLDDVNGVIIICSDVLPRPVVSDSYKNFISGF